MAAASANFPKIYSRIIGKRRPTHPLRLSRALVYAYMYVVCLNTCMMPARSSRPGLPLLAQLQLRQLIHSRSRYRPHSTYHVSRASATRVKLSHLSCVVPYSQKKYHRYRGTIRPDGKTPHPVNSMLRTWSALYPEVRRNLEDHETIGHLHRLPPLLTADRDSLSVQSSIKTTLTSSDSEILLDSRVGSWQTEK